MSGLKFALTQAYQCNYLADQQEQLLVCVPPQGVMKPDYYEWLVTEGFRRSGEQIYRPHCANCNACKSVRIPVDIFSPSKSQKRLIKKSASWQFQFTHTLTDEHYALYEQYIVQRHADGSMYPPAKDQFEQFANCTWRPPQFLEARDEDKLIAVAITDVFAHALSALYTFFAPEYAAFSPGSVMILQQIQQTQNMRKPFLYLGYQVDACRKMAYKNKFLPQQQLIDGKWTLIDKN